MLHFQNYVPTVFENYTASFEIDKHRIELNMWDTSGKTASVAAPPEGGPTAWTWTPFHSFSIPFQPRPSSAFLPGLSSVCGWLFPCFGWCQALVVVVVGGG